MSLQYRLGGIIDFNFFISGRIVRYIVGNSLAFLSGLFFTANNFVIHGAKLSFGEVLAVRSIIQIPLMSFLLFVKGSMKNNKAASRAREIDGQRSNSAIFFNYR